jgi:hypothetical protein
MLALPTVAFGSSAYTALQYSKVNSHDREPFVIMKIWSADQHDIVFLYDEHFTWCTKALTFPCFCTLEDPGLNSSLLLLWWWWWWWWWLKWGSSSRDESTFHQNAYSSST